MTGERPLDDAELDALMAELEAESEAGGDDDGPGLRNTRAESAGAAIGSFMAGLEQQIFQKRPPAVELVRQAAPVRMVSGEGLEITISLPDATPTPPAAGAGPPDPER